MSLLASFKNELCETIGASQDCVKLVRHHTTNLDAGGDLSLPSLANSPAWASERPLVVAEATAIVSKSSGFASMSVERVVTLDKSWLMHVDRSCALNSWWSTRNSPSDQGGDGGGTFEVVVDNGCDSKNDLTCERVRLYANMLENIFSSVGVSAPNYRRLILGVSSSPQPPEGSQYFKVGPVLSSSGKKCETNLGEYKAQVYSMFDTERDNLEESDEVRSSRLASLVDAAVTFDLVSAAPLSAKTVSSPSSGTGVWSSATFVLYNTARISQILASFERGVEAGTYPQLNQNPNWSLLNQSEEWELFWVYLLPYQDLLQDAASNLKPHRITSHLIGLSNCLSRYYSRVKILRDPLPSTIPVIHARIHFLKEIARILQSLLAILGLQHLKRM